MLNALSVDVEDLYQYLVIRLKNADIPPTDKVVEQVYATLSFLGRIGLKATFFILGEVARQYPQIVKDIMKDGHEIASHGYKHIYLDKLTPTQFKEDLTLSLRILEDITGQKIKGYRAPGFSLSPSCTWAWDIMAEAGLIYSSSVSSTKFPNFDVPQRVANGRLIEFPNTSIRKWGMKFNISGGRFFRLFPLKLIISHFQQLNEEGKPFLVYFHTHEMDKSISIKFNLSLPKKVKAFFTVSAYNFRINKVPYSLPPLAKYFSFAPLEKVLEKLHLI